MRSLVLIVLMAVSAAGFAGSVTNAIPWRSPNYTLTARNMAVREALETFGVAQGVPVLCSEAVTGSFSGNFTDLPASDFLDRLATMHNLTWYYDGASIYVYGAWEIRSALTDLAYMKADDVRNLLRELGVEDSRFPIKTASNDEIIMVSGPPRYVELVLETIARADCLKQKRTFNEIVTRIFPLKYTWADTVSLASAAGGTSSGGSGSAQITGVAQLLQQIMASSENDRVRESGVATNDLDSAEAKVLENSINSFKPIIKPENRLNAVIVRDAAPKMPMYERLIADLDHPQKLVEISVVTVEMTKDDALDWQLSLAVRRDGSKYTAAAGQVPQNLFGVEDLPGLGLAGAVTYLGHSFDVSASITALKKRGKARSVSRTSLVTMNNLSAGITDTQTYHAKVVGKEVASLEEVSAGTRLAISPRIAQSSSAKQDPVVWMTMELQDGGFESVTVESMPMSRTTTLETQAAVTAGQSILLAGYFRDIRQDANWGIPILRDIPWIGWIFGGISHDKETVQRLFILTPHIVDFGPGVNVEQALEQVREQASRNRSLELPDRLVRDREVDDEYREEERLRLDEQDEIRREKHADRMKIERAEMDFRADRRQAQRKVSVREWKADLEARRAEWEAERRAARSALELLKESEK